MVNVWFTSDTHFGHANILKYEANARPFENIHHMNEAIIDSWNSVVRPGDTIFHLGDFCFGRENIKIAARLNGRKKLVLGNHDTYTKDDYLQYFENLYGVKHWEQCVLSHMPVHPRQLGARWLLNVHGHLHSKNVRETYHVDKEGYAYDRTDINYFNVSCEQNNLIPIHADVIRDRVKEIRSNDR